MFIIYGATCDENTQEISTHVLRSEANTKAEVLNEDPLNHPDLHFWVEEEEDD